MPDPVIHDFGTPVRNASTKFVLRADLAPAGLKAYGAEKFVHDCASDTLAYVAPRVGHAPGALASLARKFGKKCVFFCPASKKASEHQAATLGYGNVELRFVRIAAMPVLNSYARQWAERNGATFVPFGMAGVASVTAGIVNLCKRVSWQLGHDPTAAVCAVSTGTMIRALEIGWPEAELYGMAVARNMKAGETGRAIITSHEFPFLKREKKEYMPPFPSTANYDAKAWSLFEMLDIPGSIFINVGSDLSIEERLDEVDREAIDSCRDWGDYRDLEDWVMMDWRQQESALNILHSLSLEYERPWWKRVLRPVAFLP